MLNRRTLSAAVAALSVAAGLVACESGARSPLAPSAVIAGGGELGIGDSTLKVTPPLGLSPTDGAQSVPVQTTLVARLGNGLYVQGDFGHRFQVAEDEGFTSLIVNGPGAIDAQGLARYPMSPALPTGKKVFWRLRQELQEGFGPWSPVMSFTTTGTTPPPSGGGG